MATVPESVRALVKAGFDIDDAVALRRAAMTLHRWFEEECNGTIQRLNDDGMPYREYGNLRQGIPDRERGARKRIASIVARYPGWAAYVQGDPRGPSLYLLSPEQMANIGDRVESFYSNGIAVYK